MAQIRCPIGHLYDNKRYTSCPFCPVEGLDTGTDPPARKEPRGAGAPPHGGPPAGGGREAEGKRESWTQTYSTAHPVTVIKWKKTSQTADAPQGTDVERDPVVGWLVAIDGPAQGRDFRIRSGNNTVGRDPARQIYVPDDRQIHREPHAIIVYDPETNTYHLKPGDDVRGLIHVRDPRNEQDWQLVLSPIILEPFKLIRIGATQFMFVPLCGEDFKWDL